MKICILKFSYYNNDLNNKKWEGSLISLKSRLVKQILEHLRNGIHCSYCKGLHVHIPVHKNAHDLLLTEEEKEQKTQHRNNFCGKKYFHMHENVRKNMNILYVFPIMGELKQMSFFSIIL